MKVVKERKFGDLTVLLEDTCETMYWMGFIMADGWFTYRTNSIVLGMSVTDKNHLQQYANFIGGNMYYDPPCKTKNPNSKTFDSDTKECYRVSYRNKEVFAQIVERYKLTPKKTYNPPDLSYVLNSSDDLFLSFMMGFIDGDGTIVSVPSHNSISIRIQNHISWLENIELMEERLFKIFKMPRSSKKMQGRLCLTRVYKNTAYLSLANYQLLRLLYDKWLTLGIPKLERKWIKIKNHPVPKKHQNKYTPYNKDEQQ